MGAKDRNEYNRMEACASYIESLGEEERYQVGRRICQYAYQKWFGGHSGGEFCSGARSMVGVI